ncbi:substrate-binding domain-containing protein [Actinocorallia sp. A-T 12471]|uniref:substrate-binding domain-containing protein n=1 Tax=Actinocorallia sp. A-T 12471 TaxID=3089813 RepID=UPI0029D085C1|nr:substrate-binding domain-containing protein [Actinocorallia sp. A-T 12471]MDX6740195.1 substrate-binding domain-containing protein [Actinocorallia sp. A-T 12471]
MTQRHGRTGRTTIAVTGVLAAAALSLAACSSGQDDGTGSTPKAADGKISIVYLQKQGDQSYFIGEAEGAKAKAAELGIDLKVVNLGSDANKAVSETQAAIGQKASGVIVVVPDPAVGPQLVELTKSAGVELLTSDDQICVDNPDPAQCAKENLVPRIGFSGAQMGEEVGKKVSELYKAAGWKPEETRIIAAWKQDVTVCTDRVTAAESSFKAESGADIEIIKVGTDNTPPDAQNKVGATVTANKSVKNWIVWGCNDENVTGGVLALENAGFKPDNIIGVGINGDLACKVWQGGKPTGVKASLFLNGAEVGALSVQSMYDKIKNGKEFPAEGFAKTTMVDASTYEQAGLKCS